MAVSTSILAADFRLFSVIGIAASISVFLTFIALYALCTCIYNLYFHPLKHIPGPFFARASGIPYITHIRNGTILPWIQENHKKYGDAFRIAPGEVSFISGESAWQDIYGFRTGNHKTPPYLKDRTWFPKPLNGTPSILTSDEELHTRLRRNFSHGFSDKALRSQEAIIQGFVDLLVHRLHEQVEEGNDVNIMRWYNYTTFDVIADLTFGEPLYCLRDKDYHPWVTMVFASVKAAGLLAARNKYPVFDYYDRIKNIFVDTSSVIQKRRDFFELSSKKVTDRLERPTDRPDFMHYTVKNQGSGEKSLSKNEVDSTAVILLIAGSETTATLLSGATYLLLKNPEVYSKLVHEIRSKFTKQSDITMEAVNNMEYLIAFLQEALRYYPPVPTGFPRVVPTGGDTISGRYIPEGTSVYVSSHALGHSPRNFTDPDAFVPERWLGDKRYESDNRAAVNAFSFGPRNCLGKNLAYAEMRLIMAKVLFNFDLELVDKKTDWLNTQKLFTLWEKGSLMVKLHPVQR